MPRFCFEDFVPGTVIGYGDKRVDKDEMIAFARIFDPQPFHIDEEAARSSFSGTLIASGWHTAAMHMRMMCDAFMLDSSSMGSPGVQELKWLRPVQPGDRLSARRTVLGARASTSKPDRGLVAFAFHVLNQEGHAVLEQKNTILFGLREPGRVPAHAGGLPAPDLMPHPGAAAGPQQVDARPGLPFFEDIVVGSVLELGALTFTEADIIAYASDFDPQYFHVDPVAAQKSPFGRLIASGWHTAAGWMRSMAGDRARR
ncbi:MAG TPA: MaoC/PaaZ C-terminal domain-containing protein, partial [Beijerinckiaceae bacterium]|nr:MaoC/PaaZ C-terminal domain-containing protein [Beijerinckiaceae bacterium]